MNMDDEVNDLTKAPQGFMAKLQENSTFQCLASDNCKKCCTIWSCIAIGFLLVIGLVQGEAFYQKLNGELLSEEEQTTIMNGCFLALGLYAFFVICCGARWVHGNMKEKSALTSYETI
eukprot:TRINITY_DN17297_c0_g1_i1.p1 TRINITY_DN17297_c0_g1~~TRINITY_DN17297_c0_g1_i1.p1  ORF type:complete len:118 (-),score=22.53 TRINITY_DN17297_c0_g1_i1:61-414(-)